MIFERSLINYISIESSVVVKHYGQALKKCIVYNREI